MKGNLIHICVKKKINSIYTRYFMIFQVVECIENNFKKNKRINLSIFEVDKQKKTKKIRININPNVNGNFVENGLVLCYC